MIRVRKESIDSYGRGTTRRFKTLAGARKFAQRWVGEFPELGMGYAVAGDGVCKVECWGCSLADLFPSPVRDPDPIEPPPVAADPINNPDPHAAIWQVVVNGRVLATGLIRSEAEAAAGPFGNSGSVRSWFITGDMVDRSAPHEFYTDASDLGWPAGFWPSQAPTLLGNGLPFLLGRVGEDSATYHQCNGCIVLRVFND
jgi:hypothetical protein